MVHIPFSLRGIALTPAEGYQIVPKTRQYAAVTR
jgi:hypothetical protein